MQNSTENKRLTILISLLIVTIMVAVPMIALGVPGPLGAPPNFNTVNAAFSSITLGAPANGPAMTGSYGRFVGVSRTAIDGCLNNGYPCTATGGYANANAQCQAMYGSLGNGVHVCTASEIINSSTYNPTGPVSTQTEKAAWINNGPPGYFSSLSNDCNGWTSKNLDSANFSVYGSKWMFASKFSKATSCDQQLKFACCTL